MILHHWHSVGAHCPACPCKMGNEKRGSHSYCEMIDKEELELRQFMVSLGIRVR